jgi:ribosomal protein L11 methyltransferase
MIASLLSKDLKGWRVLDCGCGTGILGIAALKGGARESVGYDIDEWSVENARHNAIINRVEDHYVSLLGDASVLDSVEGEFDLVLANINRNILLSDMPAFCEKLTPGGFLSLSGFYKTDKALLVDAADGLGLQPVEERTEGEWMCLVFQRFSSKSE